MPTNPEQILKQLYNIGTVQNIEAVDVGLIHATYKVYTDAGSFILQKLHPMLGTSEIGEDFLAVTEHIASVGHTAPRAIKNNEGNVLTVVEGDIWRLQTLLPGTAHSQIKSPKMAKNGGAALAKFHKALNSIQHTFKTSLRLHESKKEHQKLQDAAEQKNELVEDVQAEFDFINTELPNLFLPENIPTRVIHGDPKISNILFDEDENAVCLIDLDTCLDSSVLNDLGDAMRSWCGQKEDDERNEFNEEIFHAAVEGYLEEADEFLTSAEASLIPQSAKLITLELAARFLADYFNDNYFGWDETTYASRREHNLARCRGQIALYKSMVEKGL